uniref:Synaptosomal-associated protein n=1 Tax=Cryptocotyle lingua TaxID=66766 RepID=A0A7U0TIZ7_9TREM|nr:synaptosomal-associated protein [Cryptocotyle lingua]
MPGNPFDEEEPGGFGSTGNNQNYRGTAWLGTETPASGGSYSIHSQLSDSKARTQASQQRALASIANSERVGVETAAELVNQGEKLSRAERRLDDIGHLQKDSQRQLNTLSSVFGGVRNWFSRKPSIPAESAPAPVQSTTPSSGLKSSLQAPSWSGQLTTDQPVTESATGDSDFEKNLNLMSDGMSRLKGLAQGMNEELRVQNEQLDRMAPRINSINETMNKQNQQMHKLLGYKPK